MNQISIRVQSSCLEYSIRILTKEISDVIVELVGMDKMNPRNMSYDGRIGWVGDGIEPKRYIT